MYLQCIYTIIVHVTVKTAVGFALCDYLTVTSVQLEFYSILY